MRVQNQRVSELRDPVKDADAANIKCVLSIAAQIPDMVGQVATQLEHYIVLELEKVKKIVHAILTCAGNSIFIDDSLHLRSSYNDIGILLKVKLTFTHSRVVKASVPLNQLQASNSQFNLQHYDKSTLPDGSSIVQHIDSKHSSK